VRTINNAYCGLDSIHQALTEPPVVEVVIEVPRGSFLKRGSTGRVDFISPLPCPFNYGSVPGYIGLDGDLLDALVLGPRLSLGARIRVKAWGAVIMTDGGLIDDKLVCGDCCPDALQRQEVLKFFYFYAKCKGVLNIWRGRPGRNACEGWCEAIQALGRARPRDDLLHELPLD
jgi:inorganic pyrophosphatase